MKHVFCINSPINYLSMRSVIDYKNINLKDVIVLIKRNHKFDWEQVKSFPLPTIPELFKTSNLSQIAKIKYTVLFLVKFLFWIIKIKKITGFLRFELYIPTSHPIDWNLLSGRFFSKCFSYIDEGVLYYRKDIDHNIQQKVPLKLKIVYFGLLKIQRTWFTKEAKNSYVFSNEVINFLPNPIILNFNKTISHFKLNSTKEIIIAIDGCSTYNDPYGCTLQHHKTIINEVAIHIKQKYGEDVNISFKLHPKQYNSELEFKTFRELLKHHFPQINELSKETVLETYLNNENKIIFTGISSLSFYAYILNSPVYSFLFKFSNVCQNFSINNLLKMYPNGYIEFLKRNQI